MSSTFFCKVTLGTARLRMLNWCFTYGCCSTRIEGTCSTNRTMAPGRCPGLVNPWWRSFFFETPRPGRSPDVFCDSDVPVRDLHAGLDVHAAEWRPAHDPHQLRRLFGRSC